MRQCNETLNIVHEIPEMCIETTYMCYITRTNNAVREQKKDHPITEQSFKIRLEIMMLTPFFPEFWLFYR
jgi:hypothetical protein